MTVLYVLLFLTVAEHFLSVCLKDDVCSHANTGANIVTQLCGVIKDKTVHGLSVVGIIIALNNYLPHVFSITTSALSLVWCIVTMDFLYYLFHRVT